jgi:hypothetical protein
MGFPATSVAVAEFCTTPPRVYAVVTVLNCSRIERVGAADAGFGPAKTAAQAKATTRWERNDMIFTPYRPTHTYKLYLVDFKIQGLPLIEVKGRGETHASHWNALIFE